MEINNTAETYRLSNFLQLLIEKSGEESDRLPALKEMSKILNMSPPALREQLEQAKTLGLVIAKPKAGIRRVPYAFSPAAKQSIKFAVLQDAKYFTKLSEIRKGLEKAFWYESVAKLNADDLGFLNTQLDSAWRKLGKRPAEIPHLEHKTLHLSIYHHLDNTFVTGILEGFWYAYEIIGMSQYSDLEYLKRVWEYHSKIIKSLEEGDFDSSYQYLMDHLDLVQSRRFPNSKYVFE